MELLRHITFEYKSNFLVQRTLNSRNEVNYSQLAANKHDSTQKLELVEGSPWIGLGEQPCVRSPTHKSCQWLIDCKLTFLLDNLVLLFFLLRKEPMVTKRLRLSQRIEKLDKSSFFFFLSSLLIIPKQQLKLVFRITNNNPK